MPICAPGISAVLPGVSSSIVVDQQYVQSILPQPLSFLFPFLPYSSALAIGNTGAFCASDPPVVLAMPTQQQFLNFITGGLLSDYLLVDNFIKNLIQTYIWYKICGCTTIATPAPPTPPSNPGNLPVINPTNVVTPSSGQPCFSISSLPLQMTHGTSSSVSTVPFPPYVSHVGPALISPPNVTWVDAIVTVTPAGSVHDTYQCNLDFFDASGAATGTFGMLFSGFAAGTTRYNMVPSHGGWATNQGWNAQGFQGHTAGVFGTDIVQLTMELYCGSNRPGAPAAACCPPDPQITGLLNQIISAVTLMQRQLAPFAYVNGAVHSGISGSGTIAVQGLLGAKIDVTTLPSSLGREGSSPEELFDVGFMTWGTADGYPQSFRIEHDPTLSLPARASAFTVLAYDLHPGVVVTITELVREP